MSETNVSVVGSQNNLVPVSSRKSSFKKRTQLERRLLIIVVILTIILLAFIIAIVVLACINEDMAKSAYISQKDTCNSEKCITSAYSLLESMDRTIDPCEDFYEFACGNWVRGHPVSDSDVSNTWFAERTHFLLRELKELLQENNSNSEPVSVRRTKSFYGACADEDALEKVGLEPIMQVLENVSLPKQIPNSKTAEDWDIATTLALAQRYISLDSLVQLGPDISSSNSGKLMLNLSPPTQTPTLIEALVTDPEDLPKVTRLTPREMVKARVLYMTRILEEMDSWGRADEEKANTTSIASAAVKILLFAAELSSGITSEESNTTSSTVKLTIPGFQGIMDMSTRGAKNSHKIDWKQYITILLEGIDAPFDKDTDLVSVTDMSYFQNLAWLIANSQIETIQRYVWWQVVEVLAPHTNKAMRNIRNQLLEQFFGSIPKIARSTMCLRRVKKLLPMAVSYVRAVKDDVAATVARVSEMMNDIKASFNSLVHEGDWINQETKRAAQEKAEAIASFIGYQEWLLKPGKLDEYYKSLDLQENQYLLNILRIKFREVEGFLEVILDQTNSQRNDSWNEIDPLQVNAYYSRTENAIIIPAGILQFPFYGRGLEALNYGSIGSILGHELTHGFDIEGKDYGKDGKKASWWNREMLQAYEDRAQCFIKQYSNFGPTGYKVNGQLTLAENIADNGGIREAYRAYQRYKRRHPQEPALPGLEEFSHDQLLFLAYANIWCLSEGFQYDELAIKDTHSPGRYRVFGSLSNSPEFSKTWNCPTNTSMNPSNRCIIW